MPAASAPRRWRRLPGVGGWQVGAGARVSRGRGGRKIRGASVEAVEAHLRYLERTRSLNDFDPSRLGRVMGKLYCGECGSRDVEFALVSRGGTVEGYTKPIEFVGDPSPIISCRARRMGFALTLGLLSGRKLARADSGTR